MDNLTCLYNEIEDKCNKEIEAIYKLKQVLREITLLYNDSGFLKLIKLTENNSEFINSIISEKYILEYMKTLFDFAQKHYYKNNKFYIRCQHWVFTFNSDKTIEAHNDYENKKYQTPNDVLESRTQNEKYKRLRRIVNYYSGKITLKTLLRKNYPNDNYYNAYLKFLQEKDKKTKSDFVDELSRYNNKTEQLIVQAKVELQELELQKKDYKKFKTLISYTLQDWDFIQPNLFI